MDASKGSDGLLFCSSVLRLLTKRGEAIKKLNIVGMGYGPWRFECRILYRYKSLRTSHFVRKQGGIGVY